MDTLYRILRDSHLWIHSGITEVVTDLEILAATLVGEAESLGIPGMTGTACTIQNRMRANLHWLGGDTIQGVCLQPEQYQCWGFEKDRLNQIINDNPLYGPYLQALHIAQDLINNQLFDITNGAVSYFDPPAHPYWARGKTPCFMDGNRLYFDLKAIG